MLVCDSTIGSRAVINPGNMPSLANRIVISSPRRWRRRRRLVEAISQRPTQRATNNKRRTADLEACLAPWLSLCSPAFPIGAARMMDFCIRGLHHHQRIGHMLSSHRGGTPHPDLHTQTYFDIDVERQHTWQ